MIVMPLGKFQLKRIRFVLKIQMVAMLLLMTMRTAIAYYGVGIRSGSGKAVYIINSASRTQTVQEATPTLLQTCNALAATCEISL